MFVKRKEKEDNRSSEASSALDPLGLPTSRGGLGLDLAVCKFQGYLTYLSPLYGYTPTV